MEKYLIWLGIWFASYLILSVLIIGPIFNYTYRDESMAVRYIMKRKANSFSMYLATVGILIVIVVKGVLY